MRISQRMYLTVLPGVLGIFTVVALAYWGRFAHAAPEWLVAVAAIATVALVGATWSNARYVSRRIERLAATAAQRLAEPSAGGAADEIATIESSVDRLSTAVGEAEAAQRAGQESLRGQQREYAELLSLAARDALQRLDEIRLPLHILLENHFGDLNENQEEMLGSARTAAEQAGDALQRLAEIADLDRGRMPLRRDRVRPGDLVAGVLPALVAEGQQRQVHVSADVAPAIQSIFGDRGRLQLALELLLHDYLRRTPAQGEMRVSVDTSGEDVVFTVRHGDGPGSPIAVGLGKRLVAAQGGRVVDSAGNRTEIRLSRALH